MSRLSELSDCIRDLRDCAENLNQIANWLFETYLNTRIEGARTNIGLRPEDWDDVTFIPEDDED